MNINNLNITLNSKFLSIGSNIFHAPPGTDEIRSIFFETEWRHRMDFIINNKIDGSAFIIDEYGVEIRENSLTRTISSFQFFLMVNARNKKHPRKAFKDNLLINGVVVKSPVKIADFPIHGEFEFKNHIAAQGILSSMYINRMEFIESLSVSFDRSTHPIALDH